MFCGWTGGSGAVSKTADSPSNAPSSLATSGSKIELKKSSLSDFKVFLSVVNCKLLLLHLFNGLFSWTTWVSWYQKGKTSLDLNEARVDGVLGCSGIRWTICKQSASCCRQIATPTPYHSIFYRLDTLPDALSTMSKHWSTVNFVNYKIIWKPFVWYVLAKKIEFKCTNDEF